MFSLGWGGVRMEWGGKLKECVDEDLRTIKITHQCYLVIYINVTSRVHRCNITKNDFSLITLDILYCLYCFN